MGALQYLSRYGNLMILPSYLILKPVHSCYKSNNCSVRLQLHSIYIVSWPIAKFCHVIMTMLIVSLETNITVHV